MSRVRLLAAALALSGADGPPREPWCDAVSYAIPDDPGALARTRRAAGWLTAHLVEVRRPGDPDPLKVVAWKDPTLAPEDPRRLAGYLITDTLWAAKALRPFEPALAAEIERGLRRIGWYGNGLHDVLFHRLGRNLHRSADADPVHGHSLGVFPLPDGRAVDLRVFRQRWDADYDVGHPHLFAEHAVYQALLDFWNGRVPEARRRLLGMLRDDRRAGADPDDPIFWDPAPASWSIPSPATSGSASTAARRPPAGTSPSSSGCCSTPSASSAWRPRSVLRSWPT